MTKKLFILFGIHSCILVYTTAQDMNLNGQLISWLTMNPGNDFKSQGGIRYIPEVSCEKEFKNHCIIGAEASVNAYGTLNYENDSLYTSAKLKPYRLNLRLSSDQYEIRAGLQKINFGSATLLRPLMWFDQMDPRDPLQLTDGVYGLLAKYYFLNNANIWLWGLYGNENTKGWEYIPGNKKRPEFGGRVQYPALYGELALSFHNREVDYSRATGDTNLMKLNNSAENRLGMDGRWDIGIGLWFESVLKHKDIPKEYYPWQKQLNIGFDYTLGVGNGLYILHEFLWAGTSKNIYEAGEYIAFSALSLNYSIGLLDNLTGMVYYDWINNEMYRFINWQRTYDKINLYLMLFWNPDQFTIYQGIEGENLFSGKGIQFMFVYNH